jgi:hypothetical protein
MNANEQTSPVHADPPRVIVIAAAACFLSLTFFYLAVHAVISRLDLLWAEWVIYATIPLAVTFIYLQRSDWHQEITGAKRIRSLLLLSGLIFGGVVVTMGVMACIAWIFTIAVPVGSGVR